MVKHNVFAVMIMLCASLIPGLRLGHRLSVSRSLINGGRGLLGIKFLDKIEIFS